MANTQKKEKSYAIKIPVYSSELIKSSNGPLFEGATYEDMIKIVRSKIDTFQESRPKISKEQPHKAKTTEIDSIKYIDTIIGDVPAILIQISAYNTNLLDGYVETEKKITLQQNHKLGSETNFVLLYPRIIGLDNKDYKYQWLILIYEDPHKENVELVSTIKLALKKVLNISTANIKLPTLLDQLRKRGTIPELNLKFSSMINDENEVDVKLRSYLVKSRLKKQRDGLFQNVPFNETEDILSDASYDNEYQKKEIKIKIDRKEYKITQELKEAQTKIKETVEEIFNTKIGISESDFSKIYDTEFIIDKMIPVVQSYLSDNNG